MKKLLNWLNKALNIVVWIIIIVLGELYYGTILLVELILSHLIWAIEWIVSRSIKFFRRSSKHCWPRFWK